MINDRDGVWVTSEPDAKGVYHVVLSIDADTSVRLDDATLTRWASYVTACITAAEHDAAVMTLLRERVKMDAEDAAHIVAGSRRHRVLPTSPLKLHFTPGVSAFNGKPFLLVQYEDQTLGQWNSQDARQHAYHVMAAQHAALYDGALAASMRAHGLSHEAAEGLITLLGQHMSPGQHLS